MRSVAVEVLNVPMDDGFKVTTSAVVLGPRHGPPTAQSQH